MSLTRRNLLRTRIFGVGAVGRQADLAARLQRDPSCRDAVFLSFQPRWRRFCGVILRGVHRQVTAVYADILGFTQLVVSHDSLIDSLEDFSPSVSSEDELRDQLEEARGDNLTHTFTVFHHTLALKVNSLQTIDPLQCIAFSDSAFVAFRNSFTALHFAEDWMRMLLSFGVPVRMGIGTGSFRAIRFITDVSGHVRRHSSQFLGTAVVQAHQAESCGLKGMRIFVHPNAEVTDELERHFCEVHEDTLHLNTRVRRELNYLHFVPAFILGPKETDARTRKLVQAVTAMRRRAPMKKQDHYDATLHALARMDDHSRSGR